MFPFFVFTMTSLDAVTVFAVESFSVPPGKSSRFLKVILDNVKSYEFEELN